MRHACLLITVFCLSTSLATATLLVVPNQYPTIGSAIAVSNTGDTIFVHPGIYNERLILPGHDFLLCSEFYFTGDSSALLNTVIDATNFIEEDTSSVLTFVNGNSLRTIVAGFTLRGGHGVLGPTGEWTQGGAIYVLNSHPRIQSNIITQNFATADVALYCRNSHLRLSDCKIFENDCQCYGMIYIDYNDMLDSALYIERNDITGTENCENEIDLGIVASTCKANFIGNHFHDIELGNNEMLLCQYSRGEFNENIFENITVRGFGFITIDPQGYHSYDHIHHNVFRNINIDESSVISVSNTGAINIVFERNHFENITHGFSGGCIWLSNPVGEVRENDFINCTNVGAALQLVNNGLQGCRVNITSNLFWGNQSLYQGHFNDGSAIYNYGPSPLCEVHNNHFEGNRKAAIRFDGFDQNSWDLSNNYWGDPSGPYDSLLNPNGLGDTAGVNILFTPWLTEPPSLGVDREIPRSLVPDEWTLESVYPNPFNSETRFRLISQTSQFFTVTVHNLLGQEIKTLWQGNLSPNTPKTLSWQGVDNQNSPVGTGLYYIVAKPQSGNSLKPKTVKALLLK